MAKQVMQFRYYNNSSSNNYPSSSLRGKLEDGTAFKGYTPIIQLGIQTLPGTQFYLNNSHSPILIGATGIYELDLEGYAEITDLRFDTNSLEVINQAPNAHLIIDIVSEIEEAV